MAVFPQQSTLENATDRYPLLMEQPEYHEHHENVIDIRSSVASSSGSSQNHSSCDISGPHHEDRTLSNSLVATTQSPSSESYGSNSGSNSLMRRGEGLGRRQWSPFNTVIWLSIELVFTVGQIIAAVVVLSVSGHEKPQTPLFAWIFGYAAGCAASLPVLYWRYLQRNQGSEQGLTPLRREPSQNSASEPNSYITISLTRSSDDEDDHNTSRGAWNGQTTEGANARLGMIMDHLKMALDCFFAVWFVVGNVWIFGGHSSSSDAPNLYRLCIVLLTFSCIGYAMPFILCATICCCLPCIISFLGIRDDMNRARGATDEIINALPQHKFKLKETEGGSGSDGRNSHLGVDDGGFVAAGTEKERAISGEDAVCCICLARYTDNDDLRELPCSHFFHTECVDKWLKINATCPLCKFEIGVRNNLPSAEDSSEQV